MRVRTDEIDFASLLVKLHKRLTVAIKIDQTHN